MNSGHRYALAGFSWLALCGFLAAAVSADAGLTSESFVEKAAQAGMAEVEAGKVALEHTQDQEMRDFANRMVQDHSKAGAELAAAAGTAKVAAPTTLDAEHRAMVDELEAKSGEEFEAAYARQMLADHEKAVSLFQAAANSDDLDPGLVEFAQKTVPTLQAHKEMAQKLVASQENGTTTPDSDR